MREGLRSSLLLESAEAVKDWVEEVISWLASEGGCGARLSKELVVSRGRGLCREGRWAGRDWGWGSGVSSSSGCHLGLSGKLGWTGVERLANHWTLGGGRVAIWMGRWGRLEGSPG